MKKLMVIVAAAFLAISGEGRDTAIYNGKLTSAMNANGMAITNSPTPVRDGDLVNKAYVDGIAGVTPAVVTNIANARIGAEVAPWARTGQPQPTTDLTGMTNLVRGVAQAGTNYTDTVAATKAPAVEGGYLPKSGGTVSGDIVITSDYCYGLIFSNQWYGTHRFNDEAGHFGLYQKNNEWAREKFSEMTADGSPFATSNMVNGIVASASVTNAGAVASAKAYADATFLPTSGGTMTGNIDVGFYDATSNITNRILFKWNHETPDGAWSFVDYEDASEKHGFVFYGGSSPIYSSLPFSFYFNDSKLIPDGTDVATHGYCGSFVTTNEADYAISLDTSSYPTNITLKSGMIYDAGLNRVNFATVALDFIYVSPHKSFDAMLLMITESYPETELTVVVPSGISIKGDEDCLKADASHSLFLFTFTRIGVECVLVTKRNLGTVND